MHAFTIIAAFFALLAVAMPAHANLAFTVEKLGDGTQYLLIKGDFEDGDDASKLSRANRKGVAFVAFDSPGGNVIKALEVGRLIRKLGLATFQPRALECASACTFAFLGGVKRSAEAGALGVHRSFFPEETGMTPGEAVVEIQAVTAHVVSYIVEMGADAALMELALAYDSGDMRYLSASEMARYKVTTVTGVAPGGNPRPAPDPAPPAAPQADTSPDKSDDVARPERSHEDGKTVVSRPMPKIVPKGGIPREQRAVKFVEDFIAAHGLSARAALRKLADAYAEKVDYKGRRLPASDVLGEKENLFDQWPIRSFALDAGTVKVNCQPRSCKVSGNYAWQFSSPREKRKESGTDSFAYTVETEDGLHISAERTASR